MANSILTEFEELGRLASFHYADDTGRELAQADTAKRQALALFDAHPELHPEMRETAKRFIWSLGKERKS